MKIVGVGRVNLDIVARGHRLPTTVDEGATIVVAAGPSAEPVVEPADVRGADAVLSVLEVPDASVAGATGVVVLNAATARVNSTGYTELEGLDASGVVLITHGGDGAELRQAGVEGVL